MLCTVPTVTVNFSCDIWIRNASSCRSIEHIHWRRGALWKPVFKDETRDLATVHCRRITKWKSRENPWKHKKQWKRNKHRKKKKNSTRAALIYLWLFVLLHIYVYIKQKCCHQVFSCVTKPGSDAEFFNIAICALPRLLQGPRVLCTDWVASGSGANGSKQAK